MKNLYQTIVNENLDNAWDNGYFEDDPLEEWTVEDLRIDLRCFSADFDGGHQDCGMEDWELDLYIQIWKEQKLASNI